MKKKVAVALMPSDYRAFVTAARPLAVLEGTSYILDANSVPNVPLCTFEADDDAEAIELFQWARPCKDGVIGLAFGLTGFTAKPDGDGAYAMGYEIERADAVTDIRRSLMNDLTTQSRMYCHATASDAAPSLTVAVGDPSVASAVIDAMKGLLGRHEWELVLGTVGGSGEISSLLAFKM